MAVIIPDPATTEWVPLYSAQSASGLASLPPHHATHEPGGSDPIAAIATLPHHASHEPGGADQLVALSGAVITTGTIADARLSANVALRNAVNQFTVRQRISNAGGDYPRLTFISVIEALNQKTWEIHVGFGGVLNILSLTDDETVVLALVQILRDGTLSCAGFGTTPLNASYLASGTVPDARLSPNVVLKPIARADLPVGVAFRDINNNFVVQTFASGCLVQGANSLFYWIGTENPADQKVWRTVTYGDGTWRLEAMNDAQSVIQATFSFLRDGTFNCAAISAATLTLSGAFTAGAMVVNGPLTVHGGVTAQYLTASTSVERLASRAANGEIQADLLTSFGNVVAAGIVSAAGGLGSTPLNASQLGSGQVPDARLSGNVQMKPLPPVTALSGYPGGTTAFLRADGQFAVPSTGPGGVAAHASTHRQGSADPVSITQSQVEGLATELNSKVDTNDGRLSDARTPTAHAASHRANGSDRLDVRDLAGFDGSQLNALLGTGAFGRPFPTTHGTYHYSGGPDAIDITWLGGYVGNAAYFLSSNATWRVPGTTRGATMDDLEAKIDALEARIAALEAKL